MSMTTAGVNFTNSTDEEATSPLIEKLFLADQIVNYLVIVLVMLGMGGATEVGEIKRSFRRPWGILICWLSQFVIMPLVAFGLAHATDLRPEFAIGLIIQCSSPGGSMSNVFTYYAKGNVSLSICVTTCSTVLAIGAMPLALFLYGRGWSNSAQVTIPYLTVIVSLIMVLVPAGVGLFLKYKLPRHIKGITKVCSLVGVLGILTGIGLRTYINPAVFTELEWDAWLLIVFLPLLAGSIGFIGASVIRLPCSERRTISIETAGQNVALALAVINSSFPSGLQRAAMQVVSSLYGPVMTLEVSVAVLLFRVTYGRGYCPACDYGDKHDDGDGDEDVLTIDGKTMPAAAMYLENGTPDTAQLKVQKKLSILKTKNAETNTEVSHDHFPFGDEVFPPSSENRATETEDRYFM